jgi:anti-sigma factor RsiW
MKIPLRRTCKQAAALISQQLDRELPLADRLALRLHLAACRACPTFDRQMRLIHQMMGSWQNYAEHDEY